MVFFTYKGKESKFQARINGKIVKNVAHFGDIKGKNDFTNNANFAQVGLNAMQPVHYFVHVLGRNENMLRELSELEPESMYERIQEIYRKDQKYADFLTDHILTDIDQCMFRSAVRNADNMQKVTYYLFYKLKAYSKLRKAIENRYKKQIGGASVETIKEIDIIDAYGAGTKAWQLCQWRNKWDGKPIKQKALLAMLKMSRDSFNSAKRRDPELKKWFNARNQDARDMGYRGAWYAKKRVQN